MEYVTFITPILNILNRIFLYILNSASLKQKDSQTRSEEPSEFHKLVLNCQMH